MHNKDDTETRHASIGALNDEAFVNSTHTKAFVGGVSDMCIWRWLRDDRVQFPRPVQINRRNYWRLGDLRDWQAKHASKIAA